MASDTARGSAWGNARAEPLTRTERLRRVILLCCRFGSNMAYFRTFQTEDFDVLLAGRDQFWRCIGGNFMDHCVLEWCKLFADRKEPHHWARIVSDRHRFEESLRAHLGLAVNLETEVDAFRTYRDKFVAHLDSDRVMYPPSLDAAYKSVRFYHSHVVHTEAKKGDLEGLAQDFESGYSEVVSEASRIYRWATKQRDDDEPGRTHCSL